MKSVLRNFRRLWTELIGSCRIESPAMKEKANMKTKRVEHRATPNNVAWRCGMFTAMYVILSMSTPFLIAQTTGQWPTPSVALYDCNYSAVITDTASQRIINSSSRLILQDFLSDTSSNGVFLFSYGFADTTAANLSSLGQSFPLPDSGGVVDANYVIASKLVGSTGSYTLTVSIQDGHTWAHVVDGTATFSSITDNNMKSACLTAVQKILPLTTKIRSYQESLKQANPLLSINPQVDLSPATSKLALKGSTNVTITAIDCDGTPMAKRQLALEATRGSFGSSTVQTDNNGNATAVFTAGGSAGIGILTATIQNSISVTFDTTYPSGSEPIVVGNVDTTQLWVLTFDLNRSGTGYKDEFTQENGAGWQEETSFYIQSARGKFIGISNGKEHTDFDFTDSALSVSGILFNHNFSKYTGTAPGGETCPAKYWEMSGSSMNYIAKKASDNQGSASLAYDSAGLQAFNIMIPCTMLDYYAYRWWLYGIWDNGDCQTHSSFDGGHSKYKINMAAGMTFYGIVPVPGLWIAPMYSGSSIIGYTIIVNSSSAGYASDGSFEVTMDKCTATLKPFSKVTAVKETGQPKQFFLSQNYPNPFNPSTTIEFDIPARSQVTLRIYDLLGREVAALVTNETMSAGSYTRQWNAANFSSGIYFYRLQAGTFTETKKLVLLR